MSMTFEEWKKAVDAQLVKMCGLTSEELPDWSYRDAFESGETPKWAAKDALEAAKEF